MSESSPKHTTSKTASNVSADPQLSQQQGGPSSSSDPGQLLPSLQQLQLSSFPITTRDLLREDKMHEVLQLSSSQISQATACHASALVQLSNSEKSHERLQQLLPLYFYSWNLTDSHSVIVFLLLHYFLLKREHKEVLGAKRLYEEHIDLLKNRMTDLEAKLSGSQSLSLVGSHSGSRTEIKSCANASSDREEASSEVERLRSVVESLNCENEQLKHTNEELCRINEQWALDYQSLSDQVKNATGFYSVQSGASSAHSSARASPIPPGMYSQACLQCAQMELQLEAKREEIKTKERQIEDLKFDLQRSEMRLERKDRDVERLNSEHHAIMLQLQEIGDLQAAVKMKHDYRKLQYQLSQTNKQYQEAVSEKLQYQKQVEKLKKAFLSIFPFANSAPQNVVRTTSQGYSSFPMRTCRRQHHNQYPFTYPAPPTPPGLIARGDHYGSLVEKDEHSLSGKNHPSDNPQQPRSLNQRPIPSHDNHVTSIGTKSHDHLRATHNSLSNGSSNTSESHGSHMTSKPLILDTQPSFTRPSSSNSMYDSSRLHLTTSDYSSASSKSLPQQASFTGYSSTQTSSTGVSSASGGGSGSAAMMKSQAPPTISAPSSHSASYSYCPSSKSVSGGTKESMPRPTSLIIGQSGGQGSATLTQYQQKVMNQQKFECPTCHRQFPYGQQDFEQWFEHIRYCEIKPQ